MTEKMLKIKVGSFWDPDKKKAIPVFQEAYKKVSKDQKTTYFEIRSPIFIQEIETKENGQNSL